MRTCALVGWVVCMLGCDLTSGTSGSIGTFDVAATLQNNTCGPQAAPQQTGSYAVELFLHGDVLKWHPTGGSEGVGSFDSVTGGFRVQLEQDIVVQAADVRRSITGCTVHRVDLVQGVLDLGSADGGTGSDASTTDAVRADAGRADASANDGGGATEISPARFTGTSAVYYGATTGSDCAGLIGVGQGQVLALPCSYAYQLQGLRR